MSQSQSTSLRELNRQRLLLESHCNRLVLTAEAQKIGRAAAWVDRGVDIGRQAIPIFRAAKAMWRAGGGRPLFARISGLAALARTLAALWKTARP
jgi:hypothetical protein